MASLKCPFEAGRIVRVGGDDVRATRLAHVNWSTLEDSRLSIPLYDGRMPTLMERFKVPHFDAKAEADRYSRALGVMIATG